MYQSDIERFAFLFLCGKRDREILLGKEKMTFSDLDRLTYVTDFLGLKSYSELIFNMLILVGAVKMADRVVREMMGL